MEKVLCLRIFYRWKIITSKNYFPCLLLASGTIWYIREGYDMCFTALCNTIESDLSHFVIRKTTEYRTLLKKNCYLCRS